MKKRMLKRYRFVRPTIFNSIPTWVEDPKGEWIEDLDFTIDVGKYQKPQKAVQAEIPEKENNKALQPTIPACTYMHEQRNWKEGHNFCHTCGEDLRKQKMAVRSKEVMP